MPGAFGTVDPAPPAQGKGILELRAAILDAKRPLWDRFRALFGLRNQNLDESALAVAEALLRDPSALMRHECAYVLGQMQREVSIPFLIKALETDDNPMVRHESAEALGAIGSSAVLPALRKALIVDPAVEVRESCELALQHFEFLRDRSRLDP